MIRMYFCTRFIECIRQPYIIDKHHLHMSASIGVHQINPVLIVQILLKKQILQCMKQKLKGEMGL